MTMTTWLEEEIRSLYQTLRNVEEEILQTLDMFEEEYGHSAREALEEEMVSKP